MPRMKILSSIEQEIFDKPPILTGSQRKQAFYVTNPVLKILADLRGVDNKINFLLSYGYFKVTQKFYNASEYHSSDIEYVANQLNLELKKDQLIYSSRTRVRHENIILEFLGYKRFDQDSINFLSNEINKMVNGQLKPKLIFSRCIDLLQQQKTECPSYSRLAILILDVLNKYKASLSDIIKCSLSEEKKALLDALFVQEADSKTSRYRLTLLKKISQSCKPTKVKERIEDLNFVCDLYNKIQPILESAGLKHEGIKYFAGSVLKSQIFQLNQRADEDRYIHVICFIAHQYFRLQDNLVDVLLSVVRTFQNSVQREHKDICFDQRRNQTKSISNFLNTLDKDVFALINQIRSVSLDDYRSDSEKIKEISELLKEDKCQDFKQLKDAFEEEITPVEYFKIMESKSIRLQNRVSPIIKSFSFQAEPGGLRQSIEKQLNRVELANKFTRAVAVGNPREFTQTNKEDQEVAESCNRLIKNAIICWNYMYLTQKLKRTHNEENRERLLTAIKNHSPISWAHINLLGEYDFSEERMQDSLGVLAYQKVEAV